MFSCISSVILIDLVEGEKRFKVFCSARIKMLASDAEGFMCFNPSSKSDSWIGSILFTVKLGENEREFFP